MFQAPSEPKGNHMTIDETKMFRIHLKARNLSESALVCEYTNTEHGTYQDRL